jgi:CDP-alcohol phosphatidyltransferase
LTILSHIIVFILMSKLTAQDKFFDLSDYARPFGQMLAKLLLKTPFTPVHVTLLFGVSGLIAVFYTAVQNYFIAAFFIILKSGIDAADGELARLKNKPSYFGRYLDSIFDIILNFLLFTAICFASNASPLLAFLSFISIQLQGTLYNYYYVILRHKSIGGDSTSKIFEYKSPRALPGETQKEVDVLFKIYKIVYGLFDKIIHALDPEAYKAKTFPSWFMTLVSIYGLGFQLLIMAVFLCLGLVAYIIPFFIGYSIFMFVLISMRRFWL